MHSHPKHTYDGLRASSGQSMLVVAGGSLVYAEASSSLFFSSFSLSHIDAEVSLDLAKCASVAVCRYDR